ncbi:hypothetical protein HELRODRAFT_170411 [Helobdella robusta]|uniref:Uncharacterized protein n=1 Tax=Helobdella robusta TaxID=6412 RepID=T1F308_HELRO|nr:hypothetical protein HELRODRAFT_170411 [Helobdella robusta]ESO07111.1 hypothetical protein HELRODRAFT_170411 [Helobdella robusta]
MLLFRCACDLLTFYSVVNRETFYEIFFSVGHLSSVDDDRIKFHSDQINGVVMTETTAEPEPKVYIDYIVISVCIAVAVLPQVIGCLVYWFCTKKKQAAPEKKLLKKEIQAEKKRSSASKHGKRQSEDEDKLAKKKKERTKRRLKEKKVMEKYKLLDSNAKRSKKKLNAPHKIDHEFQPILLKSKSDSTISDLTAGSKRLRPFSVRSSSASEISSSTSSMSDSSSVVLQKVADKENEKKVKKIIKNQEFAGSLKVKDNMLPKTLQTSKFKNIVQSAPTLKPCKEIIDSKLEQPRKKVSSAFDQAKMKLVSEKNLEEKDTKNVDKSLKRITPTNLLSQSLHQKASQVLKILRKKHSLVKKKTDMYIVKNIGDTKVPKFDSDGFKTGIILKIPIDSNDKIKQSESDRYKTEMILRSPIELPSQIVPPVDSEEFDAKVFNQSKVKTSTGLTESLNNGNMRKKSRRRRRRASSPGSSQISASIVLSSTKPERNSSYISEKSFRDSVSNFSEIPLIVKNNDCENKIIFGTLSKFSGSKQISKPQSSSAKANNTRLQSFADSRTNSESTGMKSFIGNELRIGITMNNSNKLSDGGLTSLKSAKNVGKSLNIGSKHYNNLSKTSSKRHFNLVKSEKLLSEAKL